MQILKLKLSAVNSAQAQLNKLKEDYIVAMNIAASALQVPDGMVIADIGDGRYCFQQQTTPACGED